MTSCILLKIEVCYLLILLLFFFIHSAAKSQWFYFWKVAWILFCRFLSIPLSTTLVWLFQDHNNCTSLSPSHPTRLCGLTIIRHCSSDISFQLEFFGGFYQIVSQDISCFMIPTTYASPKGDYLVLHLHAPQIATVCPLSMLLPLVDKLYLNTCLWKCYLWFK